MFSYRKTASPASDQRGAVLLEFTMISGLMLMLLIVAMQMLLLCYTTVALQFVALRSVREIITHNTHHASASLNRKEQAIESRVLEEAQSMLVPVVAEDVHICALSAEAAPFSFNVSSKQTSGTTSLGHNEIRDPSRSSRMAYQCPLDDAGAPGGFFSIYIYKSHRIPLIGLEIPFQALAVGRNET